MCGRARCFGSPSAGSDGPGGSEPHPYCISARPFAAAGPAGHELEPGPGRGRRHVGGIGRDGGGKLVGLLAGHVLAWEVVTLAAASSPPALSDSSESNLNAAGRPGRRIRAVSEWRA